MGKQCSKSKLEFEKFHAELNKSANETSKKMTESPEKTSLIIKEYSDFLQDQYTKNNSRLNMYLKRYSFLKHNQGFMSNMIVGVLAALAFLYFQVLSPIVFDISAYVNLFKIESVALMELISGIVFLLLNVGLTISMIFLVSIVISTLNNQAFFSISNPMKEIIGQLEIKTIEKILKDEFKLNI